MSGAKQYETFYMFINVKNMDMKPTYVYKCEKYGHERL